jgi:hypothetical protein
MNLADLIDRLIRIVTTGVGGAGRAYTEFEFRTLVTKEISKLEYVDFDYAGLSPTLSYKEKVVETVNWANRFGEPKLVLWLARILSQGRPMRLDLNQLVGELEAAINPGPAAQPAAPPGGPAPLPAELTATLGLFKPENATQQQLAPLRRKLRDKVYDGLDLPGPCWRSESETERLAAILALEALPEVDYMPWLSDLVALERPLVGLIASQALTSAARCLERAAMARVRSAAQRAMDRLRQLQGIVERLMEYEQDPALHTINQGLDACDEQLDKALKVISIRTRAHAARLSPEKFDSFLTALITAFGSDQSRFLEFCTTRLRMDVTWIGVRSDDPLEYGIINLVLAARERGKEKDLIQAAWQEHNQINLFADLAANYTAIAAG